MLSRKLSTLLQTLGLRGRLLILLLLGMGPAIAMVAWMGWANYRQLEQSTRNDLMHMAGNLVAQYNHLERDSREGLAAIATFGDVASNDVAVCDRFLTLARQINDSFITLGAVDNANKLACAADNAPALGADEPRLFEAARQTQGIVFGPLHYDARFGRAVVFCALLLPRRHGVPDRVLYAVLDPLYETAITANAANLPKGSAVAVLDSQGALLARFPDAEKLAGRNWRDGPMFAAAQESGFSGVATAIGFDGVERSVASAPLVKEGDTVRAYLQIGVPSEVVSEISRRNIGGALLLFSLAGLALVWTAWVLGGRLLVRPVRKLASAIHGVADGDLGVRTGMQHEGGEIGELARAFDAMAKRLEDQFDRLRDAGRQAGRREAFLKAVTEGSSAGFLLYSGDGIAYVNHAMETLTGFTVEEMRAMNFWDLARADFRDAVRERAKKREAGEPVPEVFEFPVNTRDGSERWVGSSGTKVKLDGEKAVLITWWDVSARRRAEAALRELEATLRGVMDNTSAMLLMHREGKLVFVNQAAADAVGKTRDELIGLAYEDYFIEPDRAVLRDRVHRRAAGESVPDRFEMRVAGTGNAIRWVEVVRADVEYQGAPAVQATCFDITERKRTRELIEGLLRGNPMPTFVIDEEHRVTYWNSACERVFAVSAAQMVGTRDQWKPFYSTERPVMADVVVSGGGADGLNRFYGSKKLKPSAFMPEAFEAEDFFPQFGERGRWLHFVAAPLKDAGGNLMGAIETLMDVSEQKFAEEALRVSQEGLEELVRKRTAQLALAKEAAEADSRQRQEAERAVLARNAQLTALNEQLTAAQQQLLQSEKLASIGQLAAGVAHEINNPIGYVHSNLGTLENYLRDLFDLLAKYQESEADLNDGGLRERIAALREKYDLDYLREDVPALMHESQEGITRVKKIVQDLKDFSRADSTLDFQLADLHHGLDSTLNIVHNEIKYKADVVKEYGDLPQIECLPSQLNQVFMNLLVNAAHAMKDKERGTIRVRTGRGSENEVWVEVADDGNGISPENMKKIFDPFFTTKPVGKGTGLGLSLAYGIVQKHSGRIEVKSEVGKGTTFRVVLPIARPEAPEALQEKVA